MSAEGKARGAFLRGRVLPVTDEDTALVLAAHHLPDGVAPQPRDVDEAAALPGGEPQGPVGPQTQAPDSAAQLLAGAGDLEEGVAPPQEEVAAEDARRLHAQVGLAGRVLAQARLRLQVQVGVRALHRVVGLGREGEDEGVSEPVGVLVALADKLLHQRLGRPGGHVNVIGLHPVLKLALDARPPVPPHRLLAAVHEPLQWADEVELDVDPRPLLLLHALLVLLGVHLEPPELIPGLHLAATHLAHHHLLAPVPVELAARGVVQQRGVGVLQLNKNASVFFLCLLIHAGGLVRVVDQRQPLVCRLDLRLRSHVRNTEDSVIVDKLVILEGLGCGEVAVLWEPGTVHPHELLALLRHELLHGLIDLLALLHEAAVLELFGLLSGHGLDRIP
mmetsp:Transcript_44976/g.134393  ORF Transcript_44976/g.134393 Transcript_44976/m.134393 type:complete len:390 (-) Transcript_44976:138-1307(-)